MAEIREIGDRITILRDGRYIDTVDAKSTGEDRLVELMTGRVVGQIFPAVAYSPGETILEVEDLHTPGAGGLNGASAVVRRGEIVGFAGLVGSGKSKFAQACFGSFPIESGHIRFKGQTVQSPKTREMLKRGFMIWKLLRPNRH